MLSPSEIEILNRILPQMGKRSDIIITWLTQQIGSPSKTLDIKINDYLLEKEFAEYADERYIPNIFNDEWHSRPIRLLDRGRKLKDCGSIQQYEKVTQDEEQLQNRLNQTVLRSYYINLCLAISTGIAALYYTLEIIRVHYPACLPVSFLLLVLASGGVAGVLLTILMLYIDRRRNKPK